MKTALEVLREAEKWAMLTQTDPVPWLDDASAVIAAAERAVSPAAASAPALAPVQPSVPQTPASASGANGAGPLRLPPEPTTGIKFQVREVGGDGAEKRGKILGYVWAANAAHAAEKLFGKLVQACPGWARVEISGSDPVELFWK